MSQVITFEGYTPPARFDDVPWTEARIYEAATATGSGTLIDTIALSPADSDPSLPVSRSFTTDNGTDVDLWYWVVFADGSGDTTVATDPIQNTSAPSSTPYATSTELARILKIRSPSDVQLAAMERVLRSAAGEIDSEIDLDSDSSLSGWQLSLAAEVNLERAVEHWQQMESPFGIVGLGADLGPTHTARDSWERHALKLMPLKNQWGLA